MNCNDVKELLSLYIDNMLEPNQMNTVTEHLSHCGACKKEYEELTQILSLLANIEVSPLPEAFDRRLRFELEKEAAVMKKGKVTPLVKSKWRGWRRLSSIAAVFVVGLFSILLYNNLDAFNQYDLADTKTVKIASEDSSKESYNASKILQKEENPEIINEVVASGVESNLQAPLTNSMLEASPNTEPEVAVSNKASEEVPQMTMETTALSEDAAEENIERSEERLLEEPNTKRSCGYLKKEFNPSRFMQALSEEDAQIYTDLINANTVLSSGRDSIAAIYYVKQLKELLGDCKYELISCIQDPEGQWNIAISITTTEENGEEIKEDATYCGQDGELWKKELSLSMETV
jgi:predicted Zn-ribbon and HTH transcriptional regulator